MNNGDACYIVKAYDDLSERVVPNLNDIEERLGDMENTKTVTGVGFIKYADGGLIQYGVFEGTLCAFSIPFMDTNYAFIGTYEGTLNNVVVSVGSKSANKCTVNSIRGNTGTAIVSPRISYIAIGRWK